MLPTLSEALFLVYQSLKLALLMIRLFLRRVAVLLELGDWS